MFFRFERQILGRPAYANPAHFAAGADRLPALCRSLVARRMRRSASALRKKTAERALTNPETPAKSMGCSRANRWRKLAETGGNPQDDRHGEPTVPTLDLTQS